MIRHLRISRFLRNVTLGLSAAALTVGGLFVSGVAANAAAITVNAESASGIVSAAPVDDTGGASPMGLAPSCIYFTQYQHGNAFTGYHTNVYLDNNCGYSTRVKVIMAHGYDSGCLQMNPGLLDKKFTSNSNTGFRPYVDRLDAC